MLLKRFIFALSCTIALTASATPVKVVVNNLTPTITVRDEATGNAVATGDPAEGAYTFEAPAGQYLITGFGKDGSTVTGTLAITVPEAAQEQVYELLTITAYVGNKDEDGSVWTIEAGDYTPELKLFTASGNDLSSTFHPSSREGRYTFLALTGNMAQLTFAPTQKREQQGYVPVSDCRTLTFNANINKTIPKGDILKVTVPSATVLQIGQKLAHFVDFSLYEPTAVENNGATTDYTYRFGHNQKFNYRAMLEGHITLAGTSTLAEDGMEMVFTADMFETAAPSYINHDVNSNRGYETGDIYLNINPQGHLSMNVGDTFEAHAMRSWELVETTTNNYFIEPDFHYSVVGLNGQPLSGVIDIKQTPGSAWAKIEAREPGTAIVLVSYDAIVLPETWAGGDLWSAIWPENTGVYVVTVGQDPSTAEPNMVINEQYNEDAMKMAGKFVDAEHDVFYYLDTESGARYTFHPENVAAVTMAYPTMGHRMASYSGGFGSEGVTLNDDGSYTLLLKEGRQIVRLVDADGNALYQVLTAKKCHREIVNDTRAGVTDFRPGDKVTIQFSGLRHPANKLAAIYNMSAYVTYNGIPAGSELILGSAQYTFGSSASAQALSVEIPMDYDVAGQPEMVLDQGVIQVTGYGDPIGAHRDINPYVGRSANFTSLAHKSYFGAIPPTTIPVSPLSGVENIEAAANDGNTIYYNPQGIASDRPHRGLNIVRHPDGTVTKQFLR